MKIRKATMGDIPAIAEVTHHLRKGAGESRFFIGLSSAEIERYVSEESVLVLEDPASDAIVGYSAAVTSRGLSRTPLANLRSHCEEIFAGDRSAYYATLAVLPAHRYLLYAIHLAALNLIRVFEHHETVYALSFIKPVNEAPKRLHQTIGFEEILEFDSEIPGIGPTRSVLKRLTRENFILHLAPHRSKLEKVLGPLPTSFAANASNPANSTPHTERFR